MNIRLIPRLNKTSLVAQMVKHLPTMWETWVQSLGQEDLLEKEMATHSSILAWKIPWMEEPVSYSSWGHKESDMTEWLHFHFHLPPNKDVHILIPRIRVYVTLHSKRNFEDIIKLKNHQIGRLSWRLAQSSQKCPLRENVEKKEWGRNIIVETEEKRLEDVILLALKMKGGAMSQEMQMHSRS